MARVWWVALGMACTAPEGVTGPGPGGTTTPVPTVPQATTDGIQIGEGGDLLPCGWVDVADQGEVAEAESLAAELAGQHEGTLSLWNGVDEGLVVDVMLGAPQVQELTPLYAGSIDCDDRRVVWPADVGLDGDSVQEAGLGQVSVLYGQAVLGLAVPLADANSAPRLLTVDDYPPIALAFEMSAGPVGALGWEASDGEGSVTYYEVTGRWVGE